MSEERYSASKAFVKEMRIMVANRDLAAICQAIDQMQAWMETHPEDTYVGTALEEFDILAEAATLIESRRLQAASAG
jgi:predicted translin family RNA/ssDNA-binding protein